MTEREKLIEILTSEFHWTYTPMAINSIADYLLDNGVICPACKIGDMVYETDGNRVYGSKIQFIYVDEKKVCYSTSGICFDETAIGTSIFLTLDDVKAELDRRADNGT